MEKCLLNDWQSVQAEQIRDIAFQCPLAGGKGVFKARSLYAFIYGDTTYNDSAMCAAQGLTWRKANLKPPITNIVTEDFVSVHPNPTSGMTTFICENVFPQGTTFSIMNMVGETVKTVITENETPDFSLSVNGITAGMYICRIHTGVKIYSLKLVIVTD